MGKRSREDSVDAVQNKRLRALEAAVAADVNHDESVVHDAPLYSSDTLFGLAESIGHGISQGVAAGDRVGDTIRAIGFRDYTEFYWPHVSDSYLILDQYVVRLLLYRTDAVEQTAHGTAIDPSYLFDVDWTDDQQRYRLDHTTRTLPTNVVILDKKIIRPPRQWYSEHMAYMQPRIEVSGALTDGTGAITSAPQIPSLDGMNNLENVVTQNWKTRSTHVFRWFWNKFRRPELRYESTDGTSQVQGGWWQVSYHPVVIGYKSTDTTRCMQALNETTHDYNVPHVRTRRNFYFTDGESP